MPVLNRLKTPIKQNVTLRASLIPVAQGPKQIASQLNLNGNFAFAHGFPVLTGGLYVLVQMTCYNWQWVCVLLRGMDFVWMEVLSDMPLLPLGKEQACPVPRLPSVQLDLCGSTSHQRDP